MESPQPKKRSSIHTFDIDNFLNPWIPRSRLHYLPRPISHFLGHRPPVDDASSISPAKHPSVLLVWLFSFLGAFIGIAIIENVYRYLPPLNGHNVPVVIASFGAAAVLEYNTIESPLAQPRNLFVGHLLSAAIGVSITKLFQHLPPDQFNDLRWLAGAISVGAASTVMGATKTIHPPAGATALLAATSSDVTELGWWLLALVALGCSLMLTSALLLNNLYKQFPTYWWTPVDLNKLRQQQTSNDIIHVSEAEKGHRASSEATSSLHSDSLKPTSNNTYTPSESATESDMTITNSRHADHRNPDADIDTDTDLAPASNTTPSHSPPQPSHTLQHQHQILIHPDQIILPDWLELSQFESTVLEEIKNRLKQREQQPQSNRSKTGTGATYEGS